MMPTVFWISLLLLFYTYLGYGLLLSVFRAAGKRKKTFAADFFPPVTLIVPAYNEEAFMEKKIQNSLSLKYPPEKLSLLFITDGSTDNTAGIVQAFAQANSRLLHLHQAGRRGKSAALNRAMAQVNTPVVVFTDANTMLHPDSIQKMVRHYADARVGGVSGEKRIAGTDDTAVSMGERIYWQYESMLKRADADFYTVIGAAGELFSIRTGLFEPLEEKIILDDFVLSARVCLKGYRFVYEKEAYAMETASASIKEEQKRKVRISAGCFQALVLLKGLLNPFRNGRLAFQYFSHRVLRWTLCPLLVPVLFLSNLWLAWDPQNVGYRVVFALQCLFYLQALAGWLFSERKGLPRVMFIPYYFVFMNLALYIGFIRFLTRRQSVFWEKAGRKVLW